MCCFMSRLVFGRFFEILFDLLHFVVYFLGGLIDILTQFFDRAVGINLFLNLFQFFFSLFDHVVDFFAGPFRRAFMYTGA